jgi:hypothetical protein
MIFAITCVMLLLDLGTPPHVVGEIVGHSAIKVTMKIYTHVSLEDDRLALSRWERSPPDAVAVTVAVKRSGLQDRPECLRCLELVVRGGRTADFPLFRDRDHRLRLCTGVYRRCSFVDAHRPGRTNINATETKTARSPGPVVR